MGQPQGCDKAGRDKVKCQKYLIRGRREANRIRRLKGLLAKATKLGWEKAFVDQTKQALKRWETCAAEYYAKGLKGRTFRLNQ